MEKRLFMKGNEALAYGAIKAGCRYYFGYTITPQNDIPEYFSRHLAKVEGCFIQAESEVASINILLGASAAGARAMRGERSPRMFFGGLLAGALLWASLLAWGWLA